MGYVTAALAIGTAVAGAVASKKAGDAQEDAAEKAASTEAGRFAQQRQDFAPYREAGVGALGQYQRAVLEGDRSAFVESPGYEYRLGQGEQAINRSAAARGQYFTPRTALALQKHGQDYASGEYQNYLQNLSGLINVGSGATANLGQLGSQSAARQGGYQLGQGQAQAASYLGQGRAISVGLNNLAGIGGAAGVGGFA